MTLGSNINYNFKNEYDYNENNENNNENIDNNINKKKNFNEEKKLFFDMSLNEILKKWSLTSLDIINELIEIISLKNYNQYFSNIEDGNQIYKGIYILISDIFKTFTKDDRGYYVGISFIIISILIYYLYITNIKPMVNVK